MGPVKAGKSTLFRTLAGSYDGHALHKSWGELSIHGQAMTAENRPALVQQHAKILDQPLLQALLHPIRGTAQRSTAEWHALGLEWMSRHGLTDYIALADRPLLQCDNRIQRSISILSHIMLQPSVLMIDEPTFGLNDADATWLVDWIKKMVPHCKLWVSLHNQMQARRLADHIILIGGGRVLAHQSTTRFFQHPANEWVEQFIRTGGLSLPAPDAKAHELADHVSPPPPLSASAQAAVSAFAEPIQEKIAKVAVVVEVEPAVVKVAIDRRQEVAAPAAETERRDRANIDRRIQADNASHTGHERRKLVELPVSSRDGVELASAVGEYIFREPGAPRGFYWIVPGKLAGCPAPGVSAPIDYDLSLLARVGITRLVTLTETDLDQDVLQRHHLTNVHLPIFDREAPTVRQTHMLLVRMQKFIEAGDVLAVHCKAGLGRTGTILAAWLIRDGGLTAADSMARLRRIEPGFIQSKEQEEFLDHYEADLTQRLL